MTVQLSIVNGTELGAQECRDALFLRYGLEPPGLPTHCNGFQAKFSIIHAIDCKKGSLVTARHNELRDGVEDLAGKVFTPSLVRDNPLIYSGRVVKRMKAAPAGASRTSNNAEVQPPEVTEHKRDLIIRDLWQQGTYSVHDMRVVNNNDPDSQDEGSSEVPTRGGKGKNTDVPEGMPPAAPTLLPLFRLGGWTAWGGGDGNP